MKLTGEGQVFDRIDAAYYRLRAAEERDRAEEVGDPAMALKLRRIADVFEAKAQALLGEDMERG